MEGNVFVVGLGLIGGSMALAIKKAHPNAVIIGYDVNENELKLARSLKVIDEIASSLEQGLRQADLIILATPVMQTEKILAEMPFSVLKENVIVTDVGSTKQRIVKHAKQLGKQGITFIGGHPMAGSHKSGVAAARAHLFENAFYVLTPTNDVAARDVERLKEWLKGTKAQFVVLSPEEHDRITGVISHFPHIIAASLVHQAQQYEKENPLVSRLAAGGSAILRASLQATRKCGAIFLYIIKTKCWRYLMAGFQRCKSFVPLWKRKIAKRFTGIFYKQNNFATGFQRERKGQFHLFTIYMSMFLIILGLFPKLPAILQKNKLA